VATQQIIGNDLMPNVAGGRPKAVLGFLPRSIHPSITRSYSRMDPSVLSYNAELYKQLSRT